MRQFIIVIEKYTKNDGNQNINGSTSIHEKKKCTSSVGISEDLDSEVDNSLASGFGLVGALLPPNEK